MKVVTLLQQRDAVKSQLVGFVALPVQYTDPKSIAQIPHDEN